MESELIDNIKEWGLQKGILPKPDKLAQFTKTQEEVTELLTAIVRDDREEAKDAIGDIVVTLIMQCEAWGLELEDCLEHAYGIISKRQGKMVDGVFVKKE
jgi:NTP pyrophosphatase (non-canonical NTP hydrolase)